MEIRELPVLFRALPVERILAGQKTQTRRPVAEAYGAFWDHAGYAPSVGADGRVAWDPPGICPPAPRSPLGRPGDRLWVREAWQALVLNSNYQDWLNRGDAVCDYDEWWESVETRDLDRARRENSTFSLVYRAGADFKTLGELDEIGWRPSIHMYRWACRLVLETTRIRVERLQQITAGDLAAEGYLVGDRQAFVDSWDATYAQKGADWAENPWVWVADFKVVEKPEPAPARTPEEDAASDRQFREKVRQHTQKDA